MHCVYENRFVARHFMYALVCFGLSFMQAEFYVILVYSTLSAALYMLQGSRFPHLKGNGKKRRKR